MGTSSFSSAARAVGVLSGLLPLSVHATAFAQSSSDELARRRFESGAAYLEASDYDHALEAVQAAYDLGKRPEILLNIATVHERNAELRPALGALNQLLSLAPSADARADAVKLRIQHRQQRLDDEQARLSATSTPSSAPPNPITTKAPSPPAPVAPPAPAITPSSARLPAFIAFGIGGLAAGGAVVTGLVANSDYQDAKSACSPACSDSQLSAGRAMALTSTILSGVAVVGVGVGLTLLVTSGPDPAQISLIPRLHLAGGATSARADATWSF